MLLSQPLAAQGLGLWGHQESPVGLDISFSTRAITREAWQGVGVEVVLQVALWTLASSRTGDKHDRWLRDWSGSNETSLWRVHRNPCQWDSEVTFQRALAEDLTGQERASTEILGFWPK